jgi:septal ring factor EnvC (AmiA/AmiB activator)
MEESVKLIMSVRLLKKRAEKRRIEDQILRLQSQIANLSQQLRAKEYIRETVEDQIKSLIDELNAANE